MRAVWKFPLGRASIQDVQMPRDAQILHVGLQGGWLNVWAGVDPVFRDDTVPRRIQVVGTGHEELPDNVWHLGTVQQGPYVWHVFEVFPDGTR